MASDPESDANPPATQVQRRRRSQITGTWTGVVVPEIVDSMHTTPVPTPSTKSTNTVESEDAAVSWPEVELDLDDDRLESDAEDAYVWAFDDREATDLRPILDTEVARTDLLRPILEDERRITAGLPRQPKHQDNPSPPWTTDDAPLNALRLVAMALENAPCTLALTDAAGSEIGTVTAGVDTIKFGVSVMGQPFRDRTFAERLKTAGITWSDDTSGRGRWLRIASSLRGRAAMLDLTARALVEVGMLLRTVDAHIAIKKTETQRNSARHSDLVAFSAVSILLAIGATCDVPAEVRALFERTNTTLRPSLAVTYSSSLGGTTIHETSLNEPWLTQQALTRISDYITTQRAQLLRISQTETTRQVSVTIDDDAFWMLLAIENSGVLVRAPSAMLGRALAICEVRSSVQSETA